MSTQKPPTKNLGTPHTHIRVFFSLFSHTNTERSEMPLFCAQTYAKVKIFVHGYENAKTRLKTA